MNVAAHQKENENINTGKREAGEGKKRQDFKETHCYPSAVVQWAAQRKHD